MPESSIGYKSVLILGNDLAPIGQQAITWTSADQVHWCNMVWSGHNELMVIIFCLPFYSLLIICNQSIYLLELFISDVYICFSLVRQIKEK